MPNDNYDVFLSYSRPKDHNIERTDSQKKAFDVVTSLCYLLEKCGLRVCYDKTCFPHAGGVSSTIEQSLEKSDNLTLIASETSNSGWVEYECNYYLTHGGNPNTVFILPIETPNACPPAIKNLPDQPIELRSDTLLGRFRDLLISILKNHSRIPITTISPGFLRYYFRNNDVEGALWDTLINNAQKNVNIMGHSMADLCRDRTVLFENLLADQQKPEIQIQILLLTPESERLQQLQEVQMGMERGIRLVEKIEDSIDSIRKLKKSCRDCGENARIKLRVTDRIMYSSIYQCDDISIVTPYTCANETGRESPALLVARTQEPNSDLYLAYKNEFCRYWESGRHPEEVSRLLNFNDSSRILLDKFRQQAESIEQWLTDEDSEELPPPSELIIYPTYRCESPINKTKQLCTHCIYKLKVNGENTHKDIAFNILSAILDDAIANGITHIQFAGGGEPLQYEHLDALLDKLLFLKGKGITFGLLTNGMWLDVSNREKIAKAFTYVRFSFSEGVMNGDASHKDRFIRNLKEFLELPTRPHIGIKALVNNKNYQTPKNKNSKSLESELMKLKSQIGDELYRRIHHLRIKSMRGIDIEINEEQANAFRWSIYDRLFVDTKHDDWPKDTQIDLDLGYIPDDDTEFKCKLAPLFAVVNPEGKLLQCFNYISAEDELTIGDLTASKFKDIWGTKDHRNVVNSIKPHFVCNDPSGCACRFAKYQRILESAKMGELPSINNNIVHWL